MADSSFVRPWIALGCLVGAAELIVPWKLLGSDAYMALVAGRLVAQHGLPHADTLAVVTAGTPWVDQQWLGQLAIYGVWCLGGMFGAILFHALLVGSCAAMGARFAEKRGASMNALLLAAIGMVLVDSEYVILRAQSISMVLFAATLVLVRTGTRRAHLVWPVLALWANVHGGVLVGCAVVALRGVFDLTKKKMDGAIFVAGAIAAPFVTPYAREMPAYFARYASHVGATHELPVIEWLPPKDFTAYGMVAAVVALIVVPWIRKRERPDVFEAVVLVACAIAGLRAARNMVWFGVAVVAYGPALVDRVDAIRKLELRVVGAFAKLAPLALVAGVIRLALVPQASLERMYPTAALEPVRTAMKEHPEARLVASDIYADWILFRAPEIEGRIEIDARLELLTREEARDLGRFLFAGDTSIYPDAKLALISKKDHPRLAERLRAGVVWESGDALLAWR
jgi:hypothetical protein